MKRPLFIAAVLVLSGMVCGIKESGLTMKAAAVVMTAVLIVLIISGYFEGDNPLIFVRSKEKKIYSAKKNHRLYMAAIALAIFLLGFARGAVQSHIYNTPECVDFYEYYKPTNPGLFDYSLYLKSLDISSRAEYEAYKNTSGTKNNSKSWWSNQQQSIESTQKDKYANNKTGEKAANYDRKDDAKSADSASIADISVDDTDTPPVMRMLNAVKAHCSAIFDAALSEHDAGIYKAVILGDKSDMDTEIRNLYQDAGIAHLLAVSGLHVSMIGAGLYNILRRKLNARKSAIAASVVLFMYMLMTGASGSVIRAVIMLILNIAAAVIGRNYCMTTAISISAIVVMLYRPYMIFTSGFQLSFGAVASISLISQNIIKRIELLLENSERRHKTIDITKQQSFTREKFAGFDFMGSNHYHIEGNTQKTYPAQSNSKDDSFRGEAEFTKYISHSNRLKAPVKAFIVSASIQLGTLPMIAYHFYKIPVYGILLNFIVIPLMAAVIASGMSLIGLWTATGAVTGIINIANRQISGLPLSESAEVANPVSSMQAVLMLIVKLCTATAAAPGHYVLLFYERLSSMSLKLPYATICIGRPTMLQIIVYYLLLAAAVWWILRTRRMPRRRIAVVSIIFLAAVILNTKVLRYRDTDKLYVTAIDVGQGDSFLIKKGKSAILIDGGSSSRSSIGKNVIESFLMAKGITKLSAIAVSHADSDHINGIEYLLSDESDISTDVLVLPKAAENDADYDGLKSLFLYGETEIETDAYCEEEANITGGSTDEAERKFRAAKTDTGCSDERITSSADKSHLLDKHPASRIYGQMLRQLNSDRNNILYPESGFVLCQTKDFSLYCLYQGNEGDDKNRQSLVLLLKSGDFTMLFTGDTEATDERIFTDEAYLSSLGLDDMFRDGQLTVLKAAHHGSHSANTEEVFDTFKPQAVLISCGRNNRYGHPHEDVLQRAESAGSKILRTDESGAVSIYVDDDRVSIKTYK